MRALVLASLLCACAPDRSAADALAPDTQLRIELTGETAQRVLDAANQLSLSVLDDEVGLDTRAANNIVSHRAGPDALEGTSDDELFNTIESLDAVPWVGDSALQKLAAWAVPTTLPLVSPVSVHGIAENSAEGNLMLSVANTADLYTLDERVGLDRRAAEAIVENRESGIATLGELDALGWVAASAFAKLLEYGQDNGADPLAGCPTGIVRDDEGTVYTHLAEAMERAPIGAELNLCHGAHGAPGWGHYRHHALTLVGVGPVDVHGYLNFTDTTVQLSGLNFHGVGGGLNLFEADAIVFDSNLFNGSHLYAVDSVASFENMVLRGAQEFKLADGTYRVSGVRFEAMQPDQAGFSPVYFRNADVLIEYSDFLNNTGVALRLSDRSEVDLLSIYFGVGTNANRDGDIAVGSSQYNNVGFVAEAACTNAGGCFGM